MKNIVLIDHEPFTKRRKELFYINEYIQAGFSVEVWDMSQFIFPGMQIIDALEESYVRKVNSIIELKQHLDNTPIYDTIFIVECIKNWDTKDIFKLLSQYKCYKIRLDLYANTTLNENFLNKLSRLFSSQFCKIIKGKVKALELWLFNKINGVTPYQRYFSSSSITSYTNRINHPDYENFHELKKKDTVIDYILFIDNYFPIHPDFKYFFKYKSMPNASEYYNTLNCFFSYLEKKFNKNVIIAAHPKADYKGDEFGSREIVKYQTNNLVLNASLVLIHASNSISYVMLANKPVVFISTNGYDQVYAMRNKIKALASLLGKSVYNLDQFNFENIDYSCVDKNKREKYVNTYLTFRDICDTKNIDILTKAFGEITYFE